MAISKFNVDDKCNAIIIIAHFDVKTLVFLFLS